MILALLVFAFGNSGCKYFKKKEKEIPISSSLPANDSIPTTDTVYIETEVEIPVPIEIVKDTIIYRDVPQSIDTASIVAVYLQKRSFLDTLKLDNGYVFIADTISGNSIVSRNFSSKIKPQFKERIIYEEKDPEPSFYVGINGGLDKPNYVYSLGTSLFYQTPRSGMYQIGIGVWNKTTDGINGEFVPYLTGGYYWRINFKRKTEKP